MNHSPKAQKELASSAHAVITELMGDIHAARLILGLANRSPDIFRTKSLKYVVRIAEGSIFLALSKFADLWDNQICDLLGDEASLPGDLLRREIKRKKIVEFRSLFVAHYADRKTNPKTDRAKLEKLLKAQGFKDGIELSMWTRDVLDAIYDVGDSLALRFHLGEDK